MRKLIVAVGFALACGSASDVGTGPDLSSQPTEQYGLKVGDTVTVGDGGLVVEFVGVPTDSRCPLTIFCFAAGDATVELAVSIAGSEVGRDTLHTLASPGEGVTHGDVRLELVRLDPYPVDTFGKIGQGDYALTLGVGRLPE